MRPSAEPADGLAASVATEGIAFFALDGALRGLDARFLELSGLEPGARVLSHFDHLTAWLGDRLPAGGADDSPLRAPLATEAEVDAHIEVDGRGRLGLRLRPSFGADGINGRAISLRGGLEHQRLQQRMSQAQKMEAIGRLVGGISHDFNNLLTVIRGYCDFSQEQLSALDAELLLSQKSHCATLRKSLNEIAKASGRASTLTRQLLAYSRQQVVAPEYLDLNTELREVEKMLDRLLGEKVQLELMSEMESATVFADRGQVHQMLMNLVINAHDAMPDGGTITLRTEAFRIDADFAARFDYPVELGEKIMLRVKDCGTGIDPDHLPRIFEPFFTTKDVGRGTGLGLSTVYGIVKQSGGYIWVESTRGRGTEFQICLPAADDDVAPKAPAIATTPPAAPRGEHILVVDDDASVLSVLAQLLEKAGYRVTAATSSADALDAQSGAEDFDLLITDLLLGDTDGVELSRQLRKVQADLPVLFVSGYDPDAYKRRGVMPDQGAFLAKPIDAETLRRKVARLLEAP